MDKSDTYIFSHFIMEVCLNKSSSVSSSDKAIWKPRHWKLVIGIRIEKNELYSLIKNLTL